MHDSQVVETRLDTPQSALAVTADKAYDSRGVRREIRDDDALPVIPSRDDAERKAWCPKGIYRRRHRIENYFCRIKDWRRIATRFRQARPQFPRRQLHRRRILLDQVMSPDPRMAS
jgi:transposase